MMTMAEKHIQKTTKGVCVSPGAAGHRRDFKTPRSCQVASVVRRLPFCPSQFSAPESECTQPLICLSFLWKHRPKCCYKRRTEREKRWGIHKPLGVLYSVRDVQRKGTSNPLHTYYRLSENPPPLLARITKLSWSLKAVCTFEDVYGVKRKVAVAPFNLQDFS